MRSHTIKCTPNVKSEFHCQSLPKNTPALQTSKAKMVRLQWNWLCTFISVHGCKITHALFAWCEVVITFTPNQSFSA